MTQVVPNAQLRSGLLVPQRDDGIHLRRADSRVESEEDADGAGDAHGEHDAPGSNAGRHAGEVFDEPFTGLIVNDLVEVTDAVSAEKLIARALVLNTHGTNKGPTRAFCKAVLRLKAELALYFLGKGGIGNGGLKG